MSLNMGWVAEVKCGERQVGMIGNFGTYSRLADFDCKNRIDTVLLTLFFASLNTYHYSLLHLLASFGSSRERYRSQCR